MNVSIAYRTPSGAVVKLSVSPMPHSKTLHNLVFVRTVGGKDTIIRSVLDNEDAGRDVVIAFCCRFEFAGAAIKSFLIAHKLTPELLA